VVVTGVGATSAFGRGAAALRDGVFAGREAIAPIGRFDVAPFGARGVAALVPGGPDRDRHVAWAVEAGREALAMAGLDGAARGGRRVALVMGTSLGRGDDLTETTSIVARALGLDGPRVTFSTACTSSANAVGFARDLVASGDVDAALAGGADEVTLDLFAGFAALGVLAEGPCAPFGPVFGTTLGEGAGFVVLERAGEGGAAPLAELAGYGLAGDAFHETSPDPRGGGVARAMRGALGDAGWRAEDVDYVNAHGTGTAANDEAEWLGTEAALGPRARAIPVSASKGMLGHAQGAAGVLELLATLACVAEGAVPPSVRAERGRRRGPADAVAGARPRPHPVARFLSTSSAFGGANAVLAVGPRGDGDRPARPVSLLTEGTVAGADAVARARSGEGLRAVAPSLDPRTLDPLARLAVCACGEAWAALPSRPAGAARPGRGDPRGAACLARQRPRVARHLARARADARRRPRLRPPRAPRDDGDGVAGALAPRPREHVGRLGRRGPRRRGRRRARAGVARRRRPHGRRLRRGARRRRPCARRGFRRVPRHLTRAGRAARHGDGLRGSCAGRRGPRARRRRARRCLLARRAGRARRAPRRDGGPPRGRPRRAQRRPARRRRRARPPPHLRPRVGDRPMNADLAATLSLREATLARVKAVLIDRLKVPRAPEEIDLDAPLFGTGLLLDSVDAVELTVALESEFAIRLREELLGPDRFRTVQSLVDLVLAHGGRP